MKPVTSKVKKQRKLLRKYQDNSIPFFKEVLGVTTLEQYQERVIQTVDQNERTAIAACHDVGKSYLMARIALAFCAKYKNSKVITTAPTFNQVQRILWGELRAAHAAAKIPLGGKINLTEWNIGPEWFAIGLSPRNEVNSGEGQGTQSTFQGYHAPHILIIFDEATGIPANMWVMVEGLLTSAHVKFVAIGNPTSTESEFHNCFKKKNWAKVYLNCFDSPNLKINGIHTEQDLERCVNHYKSLPDEEAMAYVASFKVKVPYLLTAKWVVEQAAEWGMDHPLTVSKILGKFPKAGANSIFSLGAVEDSQARWGTYKITDSDRKTIGVDPAHQGTDSSIISALHGFRQLIYKRFNKYDTNELTGEIMQVYNEIHSDDSPVDVIVVDKTGIGAGVYDNLIWLQREGKIHKDCEIRGVHFGAAANDTEDMNGKPTKQTEKDKERYVNLKARIYDYLSIDVKNPNGLELLPESIYLSELPTITRSFDKKGRMYIRSKDEYKKQNAGKSPDASDSLALANFGRYDELRTGSFTNSNKKEKPRTRSGGLNSARGW
jgi:phage terminase large subunit